MNRVKTSLEKLSPCVDLMRFVLAHGQQFTWCKLPEKYRYGKLGACYKNSALFAIHHDLIYCEGYASIYPEQRPMLHAWCVSRDGRLFDRTWSHNVEIAYFGIPMKTAYVKKMRKACGSYGILDQWQLGYPILNTSTSEFLEQLNTL